MSSLSPGFRCTKRLAKLVFGTNPQSFEWLCAQLGVTNEHPHAALSDARAAAKVTKLLALESMEVRANLEEAETFKVPTQYLGEAGHVHLRAGATSVSSLASRIESLPPMMATDSSSDYLAVIFESLADLVLDEIELQKLAATAVSSGISLNEVRDLNKLALLAVSRFFLEDGLLDDSERGVLEALASQLGEDAAGLNNDSSEHQELSDFAIHSVLRPPVGGQYVLTGFSESRKRELSQLFFGMQLEVKSSVSKRTLGVIALDPDSQSGKATKARQLGIPVLGEQVIPFIRTQ
jgi:DNA polymerase-3 subunit epsilon